MSLVTRKFKNALISEMMDSSDQDEFNKLLISFKKSDIKSLKATDRHGHKESISFNIPTFVFAIIQELRDKEQVDNQQQFCRKLLIKGIEAEIKEFNEKSDKDKVLESKRKIIKSLLKEEAFKSLILWIDDKVEKAVINNDVNSLHECLELIKNQQEISERIELKKMADNLTLILERKAVEEAFDFNVDFEKEE